jgi:hypothetical protein
MKNNFGLTMSLAVFTVCAIGVRAQESRNTKTNRPETISMIGCVDRADQLNAANPGTTADSLSFVLTHASRDGKAASSTPTADTRASAVEPGSIYRLDGTVAMINPHVGHKVQVSGTVEAIAGTSGGTDPASAANAPQLKVDSIKMLGETCAR